MSNETNGREILFLDIPINRLANAFTQMLKIGRQEDFLDAKNEKDLESLIADTGYDPDRDFVFTLFADNTLAVRSQSAQ